MESTVESQSTLPKPEDEYAGEQAKSSIPPSSDSTTTTTESTLGGESEIIPTGSQLFKNKYGFAYPTTPRDILTNEMIQFGISFIGPAIGTSQMAYLKLEIRNKQIRNIDLLSNYVHLRLVDLTDNVITELEPLAGMKYLQVLNVEGNKIKSVYDIPHFRWLQALNVSRNELTTLNGFQPNTISYLNLSNNNLSSIESLTGDIFPNLLLLELRGNFISSLVDIELPKLRHLYIAKNILTNLNGIQNCPALELIHARQNKISSLENFPNLEKLKYINLRQNELSKFTQTIYLGNSPNLESVILLQNKIELSNRYRFEICSAVLSIKRLDKSLVNEVELVEGRLLRSGRMKELIGPLEDDPTVISPPPSTISEFPGEGDGEAFADDEEGF